MYALKKLRGKPLSSSVLQCQCQNRAAITMQVMVRIEKANIAMEV